MKIKDILTEIKLPSLEEFIKSPLRNSYVRYKKIDSYYRKGPKMVNGVRYNNVLTRANTQITNKKFLAKGLYRELDKYTEELAKKYGFDGVFVENIVNPFLSEVLKRYGYEEVQVEPGNFPSFFKKLK